MALVARGAAAEDQLGVLEQVLAQAISAVENYVAEDWKEEGRRTLLDAFRAGKTTDEAITLWERRSREYVEAIAATGP